MFDRYDGGPPYIYPYDYDSVTHIASGDFAKKDGLYTILRKVNAIQS
jgi:hypothetical protein